MSKRLWVLRYPYFCNPETNQPLPTFCSVSFCMSTIPNGPTGHYNWKVCQNNYGFWGTHIFALRRPTNHCQHSTDCFGQTKLRTRVEAVLIGLQYYTKRQRRMCREGTGHRRFRIRYSLARHILNTGKLHSRHPCFIVVCGLARNKWTHCDPQFVDVVTLEQLRGDAIRAIHFRVSRSRWQCVILTKGWVRTDVLDTTEKNAPRVVTDHPWRTHGSVYSQAWKEPNRLVDWLECTMHSIRIGWQNDEPTSNRLF